MTCGVETMMCLFFQSSILFSGETSPVKTATESVRVRRLLSVCACWLTSGFVGESKRMLLLSFDKSCAITSNAIMVFPMPVGRTTRVLAFSAECAILY